MNKLEIGQVLTALCLDGNVERGCSVVYLLRFIRRLGIEKGTDYAVEVLDRSGLKVSEPIQKIVGVYDNTR